MIPGREEVAYLVRAARWELIPLAAAPGIAFAVWAQLRPVPMPLAVVLGTSGIALGAPFVLDDPAATTLGSLPADIRRRLGLRASLAVAVSAAALGYLLAAVWTPLRFGDVAVELGGLVALSLAAGTVAAARSSTLAGISGAGSVTVLLALDSLVLSRHVLVSGGTGGGGLGWWGLTVLACGVTFGLATRDPALPSPVDALHKIRRAGWGWPRTT